MKHSDDKIQRRQDKKDGRHLHRREEARPSHDRPHDEETHALAVGETTFEPQTDHHAALLSQAGSDVRRRNIILQLQRTYGNSYLQRLLSSLGVQAKLTVNAPNDVYEQEANRVADMVTRAISAQAQGQEEEEELLQAKPASEISRQEEEEEEELQMQPVEEEEEELQTSLQRQEEEEEPIQTQPVEEEEEELQASLQRQEEEEEPIQTQQRQAGAEPRVVASDLESRINGARGGGQPLPESVRNSFEPHFQRDFRAVRVHTDAEADTLSRHLGAKAFTTSKDVFFREGAYQPDTDAGKGLLAHELTHVVQQSSGGVAPMVQGFFKKLKKGLKKLGKKIKKGVKKGAKGIWGGLKKAAKGVKKGAKKVWGGLKKAAKGVKKGLKKAWGGIKKAGKAIWGGLKKVGEWTWDKAKGIFNRAKQWVTKLPARLKRFFSHIWEGVKSLKPWSLEWWKSLGDASTWKDFGIWLGKAAIYAVEVTPIPELMETIADIIKFNTRPLTDAEKEMAKPIFADKVDYNTVRIDERSFVVRWTKRAYVSLNVINAWGELPPHSFLHELTHVWQYQKMGAVYIPKALSAQQMKDGYKYGGAEKLEKNRTEGMKAFNFEQQASIVEDYTLLGSDKKPEHSNCTKADLPLFKVYIDNIKAS